jgi:hypothetical protein
MATWAESGRTAKVAGGLSVDESRSCCGVKEITGIREFEEPEQVLEAFLKEDGYWNEFNALYLFTGVEEFENGIEPSDRPKQEDFQDSDEYEGELDMWREENFCGYGSRLASYIQKHKLGRVWTTGQVENRHMHDGRMIQAWLWHPNEKRLAAWGKARGVER